MEKALTWIRKSKGTDDDIGLKQQRRDVSELAHNISDEVETLDLGIHTGFTTRTRDEDSDKLLDQNEEVLDAIDRLANGEYDYLVAYDDRRICRDGFREVIEWNADKGGAETVYFADVEEDDFARDVRNRAELETKLEEIRKAKKAIREKKERGDDLGRPPLGFTYSTDKTEWIIDETEFEDIVTAFDMRSESEIYESINDETGISIATLSRLFNEREEEYRTIAESNGYELATLGD